MLLDDRNTNKISSKNCGKLNFLCSKQAVKNEIQKEVQKMTDAAKFQGNIFGKLIIA